MEFQRSLAVKGLVFSQSSPKFPNLLKTPDLGIKKGGKFYF